MKTKYSAGLAIVCTNKLLVCHTAGRQINKGWGIPKGGIEEGETPLDAAIRETWEEIGVRVPVSLIDTTPYTFLVTSRKYKYNKIVTYYVVKIESLSQLGLDIETLSSNQLQLEEVDAAGFYSKTQLQEMMMLSQQPVLSHLTMGGLLEAVEDPRLKKIRHYVGSFQDYLEYWHERITKDS